MKYLILFAICVVMSCEQKAEKKDLKKEAQRIARQYVMVDGHIDVPYKLIDRWRDISIKDSTMNFDYIKAKTGGIDAPFMSIYVGRDYQQIGEGSASEKHKGGAYDRANSLIDLMERLQKEHPDKYKIATNPAQIRENFKKGIISLPMGMENGAPIEGNLKNLRELVKRGIRYITLTHSKWNHICDSSYDEEKKWNGLSPFGEKVVKEMNKLGCFIDISHVSDSTFYDVIKLTKAPLIASHSSCRKFTPGFERNMNDEMIKELAKNGGVIMINFGSSFINKEANSHSKRKREMVNSLIMKRKILSTDDDAIKKIEEEVEKSMPYPFATVQQVADHIDHVVKIAGINHVGLGSDFDGVGDSLPEGLKTVEEYPNLIEELLKRGYSEEDIVKIMGENVLLAWDKMIEVSKTLNQ